MPRGFFRRSLRREVRRAALRGSGRRTRQAFSLLVIFRLLRRFFR